MAHNSGFAKAGVSQFYLLLQIILLAVTQSCSKHPDLEAEKKAILAIHHEQRKAHLERNATLLLHSSSLDYIEVNRGIIKSPTQKESYQRFKAYFDEVEFIKWDDVTPPVISFSDDATMATSVVDKLVITKRISESNRPDTAHYAWLAVFKKVNGKWQMHRMGSTNK